MALQRSGQSAAMMLAVRAPQSKPARTAFSILSASHQCNDVESNCRWLAVPERCAGKKACRAVPAEIRDNHAIAFRTQYGRDINEAVNVVRPAMQKNHCPTIGRPGFSTANGKNACIDLLQRIERRVRSWPGFGCGFSFAVSELDACRTKGTQVKTGGTHSCGTQEAPSIVIHLFKHLSYST